MRDLAKIVQEPGELVERCVARFRIVKTKCSTVMIEKDCLRLVQDTLLLTLKKHFQGTKFFNLYHMLSEVVRYEKVRVTRASSKAQINKGIYYWEVAKMLE